MSGNGKQKVVVQLPGIAKAPSVETRYTFELEALLPLAELVEVAATTEEDFLAEASDAAAIAPRPSARGNSDTDRHRR